MSPNWCNGSVKVKGNPEDIKGFCRLFVFETEDFESVIWGDEYFARSFMNMRWEDFEKRYLTGGDNVTFPVMFAWSCYSCIIEGYPNGEYKVTLPYACKKFNVNVEIETEEEMLGFEEKVKCSETGELSYESVHMEIYKCSKCGNKQFVATSYELEGVDCDECGCNKWELVKDNKGGEIK